MGYNKIVISFKQQYKNRTNFASGFSSYIYGDNEDEVINKFVEYVYKNVRQELSTRFELIKFNVPDYFVEDSVLTIPIFVTVKENPICRYCGRGTDGPVLNKQYKFRFGMSPVSGTNFYSAEKINLSEGEQ